MRPTSFLLLACVAPVLFGDTIQPYNINDNGLIVGVDFSGPPSIGFVYSTATQTFTFIGPPGATGTQAIGINDSNQVSGAYSTTSGDFGFLYKRRNLHDPLRAGRTTDPAYLPA